MLIFGTMDVAFGLRHNINAFIHFQGDPVEVFHDTASWVNVMKMADYVCQTFVGDSILVCMYSYETLYKLMFQSFIPALPVLDGIREELLDHPSPCRIMDRRDRCVKFLHDIHRISLLSI